MNNIYVLNKLNGQIVYNYLTGKYYVHIGPIFGYDDINNGSLFLQINEKLINNTNNVFNLFNIFCQADWYKQLSDSDFKYEEDFLFSENLNTLYNEYCLENNIESINPNNVFLQEYIDKRNDILLFLNTDIYPNLTDIKIKDMMNLEYFYGLNELENTEFTKEELDNFYSTFCGIILKYYKKNNKNIDFSNIQNNIYLATLEYFKNFKSDKGSQLINLILNSTFGTANIKTYQTCGCNTESNGGNPAEMKSCYNLYAEAMLLNLKKMLGDDKFYNEWFFFEEESVRQPDEVMINELILLIDEFKKLGYNLEFGKTMSRCNCESISDNQNNCNYQTLDNYKQVLLWVKENKIKENKNKIKIYGEAFGELLPNLQF